jgi:hypothetical protein
MRYMQETPLRSPLEATEPQKGGEHRRIAEEPYDFSQIDFSQPEIRQAVKGALREWLKYRVRRLSEEPAD